jgi:ABC-type Fe3+-hydroxamate transport system substrate-binding protein
MRIVKTTICALLLLCTLIFTVGCNSGDSSYPIGNTTFNSKPEKVAVLSPNVADIVCQLGMEKNITLISSDVITDSIKDKKTCGNAIEPDTKKIIENDIEVVLADDNMSDGAIKTLEDNDVKVVQFHYGNTGEDILTTYTSIGAILNGETGKAQGNKAYTKLMSTLKNYKTEFSKKHSKDKLLFLEGTGPYVSVIKESWYGKLLAFTGTDVVTKDVNNSTYDVNMIDSLNPKYLVCNNDTYKSLENKGTLKKCDFNKSNGHIIIEKDKLKLQGKTAIENVEKILQTIDKSTFEKIKSTPTTTVEKTTKGTASTTVSKVTTTVITTTVPTTTKPKEKYPLQSKYKVKFTDSAIKTMTLQSQNDYNKAMQERLTDLGYLASGNATGYFGDMTKTALETFQKNNGLSATGTVDSKTLQVMFSSSAKKV